MMNTLPLAIPEYISSALETVGTIIDYVQAITDNNNSNKIFHNNTAGMCTENPYVYHHMTLMACMFGTTTLLNHNNHYQTTVNQ